MLVAVGAAQVVLEVWRIPASLAVITVGGLDPSSTTIVVGVDDPVCHSPVDRDVWLDVVETSASVVVTARVKRRPFLWSCNDEYAPFPVEIELDAPLGARPVLDGSVDPPRPVVQ